MRLFARLEESGEFSGLEVGEGIGKTEVHQLDVKS